MIANKNNLNVKFFCSMAESETLNKTYVPYIYSKNQTIQALRHNKEEGTYPLGKFPFPVIISHGSRSSLLRRKIQRTQESHGDNYILLNSPDKIKEASNKVSCKETLQKFGIPTANFVKVEDLLSKKEIKDPASLEKSLVYPLVAKKIIGMGGEGMSLIKNYKELKEWHEEIKKSSDYALKDFFLEEVFNMPEDYDLKRHYTRTKEFRVSATQWLAGSRAHELKHFIDENCISFLQKKMRKDAENSGNFGRNLREGETFFSHQYSKNIDESDIKKIILTARSAIKALELDYGAVDILFSLDTKEVCILEVNTAPSFGQTEEGRTLKAWQEGFVAMIMAKAYHTKTNLV